MWRHLWNGAGAGLEHLTHRERSADSVVLWVDENTHPCRLSYHIDWDDRHCTRRLAAQMVSPGRSEGLELTADGEGVWYSGGKEISTLAGCLDVDLWPTPFTNSLPIRRLGLNRGGEAVIRVAYIVAGSEFEISATEQRYSRLGSQIYRFESLGDGFTADLVVDENELVITYPGLFERIA